MANLESLMNAVEIGRQRVAAQKQKEESQRFNFGSALIPSLMAVLGAPFTGGASLAALPQTLLTGAAKEGLRASNPQGDNSIGNAAIDTVAGGMFPSENDKLKQKWINAKTDEERMALMPTAQPEVYGKALMDRNNPQSELKMFNLIEPAGAYDDQTMLDLETGNKIFDYQSKLLPGITKWKFKKGVNPFSMFGGGQ